MPLTLEAHMLVDIFLSAGAAYLHFRLGEFAQAQGLLHRASILDHRLATDFDLPLMSAHRLQLAQNLIRVHARQNHQREAVEFAILFLDYLEFRNDVMPITLASPRALLDSVPASVGAHYFDRICSEIALLMAGRTDFDVASLFAPLSHHAWSSDCAESHFGRMAHAWLRCKAWLVRDKPDEFLSTAIGIIRRGRGTEPLLWFATIFDAIAVCRGLGGEAAMTAKWLAREAAELPDLPPPIREAAAKVR